LYDNDIYNERVRTNKTKRRNNDADNGTRTLAFVSKLLHDKSAENVIGGCSENVL